MLVLKRFKFKTAQEIWHCFKALKEDENGDTSYANVKMRVKFDK